jgi:DNA polymerase-3 subunit gamma/tau
VAFQSLYRKYRPQRFGDLVGQEHVTTALRNAVREGRVAHAYLLSGPRGTGKTTTARILAKALNCLDLGDDGEPCGVCENCTSIAAGTFADLVEMDAASNNGVDAIRDLVERVSLGLGATSKRKVYLIDEVHMLTGGASNALLKTLEEPPGHVVFVLATTNPEKVLPTIRSRTQHFELRLLTMDELTGLLGSLLEQEGITFEPDALSVIARAGAGSARDAESLLDQALAHADGALTLEGVERVFGGAPFAQRIAILDAVAAEDVAGALTGLGALLESGHEPRRIAEELVAALRDAFLLVAGRGKVRIDATEEQQAELQRVGEALGNAALVRALETLGTAVVDMRGTDAADPRLVLEIALVRLARRETGGPLQVLTDRVDRLEQRLADGGAAAAPPAGPPPAPVAAPASGGRRASGKPTLGALKPKDASAATPAPDPPAAAPAPSAAAAPSGDVTFELDDVIVAWEQVLQRLAPAVKRGVQEAQPLTVDGNVVTFGVSRTQMDTVKPRFVKDADAIRAAFIEELGAPPRFKFTVHDWTGGGDGQAGGKAGTAAKAPSGGGKRKGRAVANEPEPEPAPDPEPPIDLVESIDPEELVDAPPGTGAPVDSISRLTDAFGAKVVDEQPRT